MSAASNARWIALSQASRVVLQMLSVAVLARLLSPKDYGLMAMIAVVTNFAGLLRDMGTGAAIVQKKDLTDEVTAAVFWFNVLLGALLSLTLLVIAFPVAAAFRAPDLQILLEVLSPVFLLGSLGSVHRALLERVSSFGIVVRIEITNGVISLIVMIIAAWQGAEAFSWVIGILTSTVISTVQLWLASKWRPARGFELAGIKEIFKFSGNFTAFTFLNYFSRNADGFIVGRYLGSAPLGIYSSAYKIMLFPVQNMAWAANRALYPVMCRMQDNIPEMASLYMRSLSVIVALTAPLMMGVFVLREPFVLVAMGPKWLEVAEVLKWLAPVGFLQSITSTTGTVSMVRGRTDVLFYMGVLSFGLQVGAFVIGVQWGLVGVAACYLAANVLNAIPVLAVALRQLHEGFRALFLAIWAPMLCAAAMGGALALMRTAQAVTRSGPEIELLVCILSGAAIYVSLFILIAPDKARMLLSLAPQYRKRPVG